MKQGEAITCKKCGVKHYLAKDGMGHIMPVFCCGGELNRASGKTTSSKALKVPARKKK